MHHTYLMRYESHELPLGAQKLLLGVKLTANKKVVKEKHQRRKQDDQHGTNSGYSGILCLVHGVEAVVWILYVTGKSPHIISVQKVQQTYLARETHSKTHADRQSTLTRASV